jgi:hypothetical protein
MIKDIEQRFKEVTELLDMDLSKYPIKKTDYKNQQQKTSKESAKERGYITTPIFLVDTMIAMKYKELTPTLQSCDLCAGEAGQFTIRLMRMLYNKFKMDVNDWLENYHTLVELAPLSCAKLVYIYGPNINLYCGDATKLSLTNEDDKGILFFDGKEWKANELVNELIKKNVVKNSIKLLDFIFENHDNIERLKALQIKLSKVK